MFITRCVLCVTRMSVYIEGYRMIGGLFRPQAIYRTPSPPFDKSTSRVRVKIDGLRLVGGNRDSTNAPGHGDDDARFYDRQ